MQIADESKPLCGEIRGKMEQYRDRLLAFGMQEPVKWKSSAWHWLFFKPAAEVTAFVVNLTGHDGFISVTYGYASTAFTRFAGCENQLADFGVPDEQITLRENIIICDEADEASANRQIGAFYRRYQDISKDDLLIAVKEKRKAFIQQMAVRLKPLGFRKKANTWTRPLEGEYYLMFNAQKSSFSDEYYFNVYIGKNGTSTYGDCYYSRIAPQGMSPMDWQKLSNEEFGFFLDQALIPALEHIIRTPLRELGTVPSYWRGCHCDRKKCAGCWMQKNLWEARA